MFAWGKRGTFGTDTKEATMATYASLIDQDRVFQLGEDLVNFCIILFKDTSEPVVWLSQKADGSLSIVAEEQQATRFENMDNFNVSAFHQFVKSELDGNYHSTIVKPRAH